MPLSETEQEMVRENTRTLYGGRGGPGLITRVDSVEKKTNEMYGEFENSEKGKQHREMWEARTFSKTFVRFVLGGLALLGSSGIGLLWIWVNQLLKEAPQ